MLTCGACLILFILLSLNKNYFYMNSVGILNDIHLGVNLPNETYIHQLGLITKFVVLHDVLIAQT